MTYLFRVLLVLPFLFLSISALTYNLNQSALHVLEPWANATPSVAKNAAVYLEVKNQGEFDDWLIGASLPAGIADSVQLHRTVYANDMASIQEEKNGLMVPAGGVLQLKPRGTHIMLLGLKKPLQQGDAFPINLIFRNSEVRRVEVLVDERGLSV